MSNEEPELDHFDDEDVPAALERDVQTGPGFSDESELDDPDFDSFATEDVEVETP